MRYRVAGHGQAIILLSGGPGLAGEFLEPIYEHLRTRYRAVLPDQRGTGASSALDDSTQLTVDTAVGDVERLRARLGEKRVVLLGHSWGGILAMAYASRHPEHVAGLVLLGSGGLDPGTAHVVSERLRAHLSRADVDSIQLLAGRAADAAGREARMRAIRLLNWKAYEYHPASVRILARYLNASSVNDRTARLVYADLIRSSAAIARRLDTLRQREMMPVLVTYGEVDPVGMSTVEELRRRFPQATVTVLPRSGHHPWIEAPYALYRTLDMFLRSVW